MQSNDLQTNGKGEGLAWALRDSQFPLPGLGAGFCSSQGMAAARQHIPAAVTLQLLPQANAGTCGTLGPLGDGTAKESTWRGHSKSFQSPLQSRNQPRGCLSDPGHFGSPLPLSKNKPDYTKIKLQLKTAKELQI